MVASTGRFDFIVKLIPDHLRNKKYPRETIPANLDRKYIIFIPVLVSFKFQVKLNENGKCCNYNT